jgi:hypothetical protein
MQTTSPATTAGLERAGAGAGAEGTLDPVSAARLRREIGSLRDRARGDDERALAGAFLAAELAGGAVANPEASAGPSQRMFEYGILHERATAWDGRSPRSGTITYVASGRVEQYAGQQVWVAYSPAELGDYSPEMGDQVRIARRGGAVAVEHVAPNRLGSDAPGREARSGMTLYLASPVEWAELEATARSVAQRHSGGLTAGEPKASLDFKGAALEMELREPDASSAVVAAASILELPIAASVRLEVTVHSNKAAAARTAECALTLCAALLTSEGNALGSDDSGAIFSAEELYALGAQNEARGTAFAFAAAAARRAFPPAGDAAGRDEDALDELTLYSALAWRADFALSALQRALDGLADGASRTGDPVVPTDGAFFGPEERGEPGTLQPLVQLYYDTVQVEVSFLDATAASPGAGSSGEDRPDVSVLLGRPVKSVLLFALRRRGEEAASEQSTVEMNRADAFVTALAALCARRGDCVAADAGGSLYDPDALLALALHRRGKASSWSARVAAALERFRTEGGPRE